MEGIRLLLPLFMPKIWPPPPHTGSQGQQSQECPQQISWTALGWLSSSSFIVFLFLTWSKNLQGTSQEQGPFLALGRVKDQTERFSSYFFPRKWNSNWNHMSGFSELQSKARTGSPAAGSLLPPCQLGFTFSVNEKLEVHPVLCKNSLLVMNGVTKCPGICVCVTRYSAHLHMYMHMCVYKLCAPL